MTKSLISLNNINLYYNKHIILNDDKLTLFPKQITLIVGDSGCGKSSLLNLIAGLIQNDSTFKTSYNNKTYINHIPREFVKQTSYLFQDIFRCFNPLYKLSKQINFVNLDTNLLKIFCVNNLNKYPYEYSGGELQKILLCIILSQKSTLYLLDEPTHYLDFKSKQILVDIIKDFKKNHQSFLITSHCKYLIQQLNDNIFTFKNHKLITYTPIARLVNKYIPSLKNNNHINFKNYTLAVKNKILLQNINYKLDTNGITILRGNNGDGKSSFAFAISNIYNNIYVSSGEIIVPSDIKINYVFQNYSQSIEIPFNVKSILLDSFTRKLSLFTKYKKILTLCKKLKLHKSILTKYPAKLSGGEKQKISLLRALLNNPNFLILDEITSSQDSTSEYIIMQLIKNLNEEYHIGFLIISHQNLASQLPNAKIIELRNKTLNEVPNE